MHAPNRRASPAARIIMPSRESVIFPNGVICGVWTEDRVMTLSDDRKGDALREFASNIKTGWAIDSRFEVRVNQAGFLKDLFTAMGGPEKPDVIETFT